MMKINEKQTKEKLFDEEYEKMIKDKYLNTSRWSWPAGGVYILDPNAKQEKEILECIYKEYPPGKHKKQIKNRITSSNNDEFWGAWAELRVYDWLRYKKFKLTPEFILGEGRPDYLVKYPVEKSHREVIMEVTAVNAESQISRKEDCRIRQMLAKLDEIAHKTNYIFWIYIPSHYLPFPYEIDYKSLQDNLTNQIKACKFERGKHPIFLCQSNNIVIQFRILQQLEKNQGFIRGYSLGFTPDEDEINSFKKRVYDRLLGKIEKYKDELKKVNQPFIIALFVKGPFMIGAFEDSLKDILNLKTILGTTECRRLSGIILYETFTFHERDHSYVIDPVETLYCNPNAEHPLDEYFESLLNL